MSADRSLQKFPRTHNRTKFTSRVRMPNTSLSLFLSLYAERSLEWRTICGFGGPISPVRYPEERTPSSIAVASGQLRFSRTGPGNISFRKITGSVNRLPMYKTNIVKRALYLWRGREAQSSLGPAAPWALCRFTVFLFLSLSLFLFRRPSRAYFLVKLYGACGWPLVQVRNERGGKRRGEEGPRGERGARVLRRRPPDVDWASRNFRACNYP